MIIKAFRKNIGTIIACLGFMLLCIITFGDLGEFMTETYWKNVKDNFASIGFLSVALTLIQVSIKQGLAEQALQSGLNTDNTAKKYYEHKTLINTCTERMIYLPYFLQIYNKRHTALKRREFLIDNNFSSEKLLMISNNKKLIKKYTSLKILVTVSRIKWATTDIIYNKYGQIVTLQEHRSKRILRGISSSCILMCGVALLTRGLFEPTGEPLWQKCIKLLTYVLCIAIGSIFSIIKEYEKGAFGVPNDLDEINEIWTEFAKWEVPFWVIKEVDEINEEEKVKNEENQADVYNGTTLQKEQKESEVVCNVESDSSICLSDIDRAIFCSNDKEFDG